MSNINTLAISFFLGRRSLGRLIMDVSIRAADFVLTHTMRSTIEDRLACALSWTGRQSARLWVLLAHTVGPGGQ